ncbi:MAG: hypothetical protein CVV47_02550 [Spirochaetae bacterium HGW-Spirochaetae-3]|nr:MAG: hypothetical protein CVV47_02550 [Spirochaetae bacterium HGW-Spirochaetae-3]
MTKVESYLIDLDISYEEVSSSAFYIEDQEKGLPGITITLEDPIVIVRARVMKVPPVKREELFEKLLRLNGTDMVHGAYGLDGDDIVLIDTLEYDTMDKPEFEATLDSIGLALSRHYSVLGAFRV